MTKIKKTFASLFCAFIFLNILSLDCNLTENRSISADNNEFYTIFSNSIQPKTEFPFEH